MKKSSTSPIGVILILLSAFLTSIGQFLWKMSAFSTGYLKIIYMVSGFALFFVTGAIMVFSYRFGELSVLQPILSIGFVFSLVLGKIFFHEVQTPFKYAGIALILAGVFFLRRSGTGEETDIQKKAPESQADKTECKE